MYGCFFCREFFQFLHFKNNICYYSFKIFPQFWLAKNTRIIHHNQLLMTKFGRILCLRRKWRQKCSPLQVNTPLPRRPDEVELVWLSKKMADISLIWRVRTTARTRRNNSLKNGKNSKKTTRSEGDICYLGNTVLDRPKLTLSKMNLTSMQVSMF